LTTWQIIHPRAATGNNFFFPWFNPKNSYNRLANAGIILLNPFGEQAKWIPATPYAFSGTLCKRHFTMPDVDHLYFACKMPVASLYSACKAPVESL
jgi:hypothetical protein